MSSSDFLVIGGGIVGVATARELARRYEGATVTVLEKEDGLARHQTGHNSGVIHAGVYYAPGSLKAQLCFAGAAATKQFCDERGIAYQVPGKLVVATREDELARLAELHRRSVTNGLEVHEVDAAQLRRMEPNITGIAALHVPATGIVDYAEVTRALAADLTASGGRVLTGQRVTRIVEDSAAVWVHTAGGESHRATQLVVCAGTQADRMVRAAGQLPDFAIVPFKGEYYYLPESRRDVVSHLIYPVPDPALPFLGVHLTRHIDGRVSVGPNAVLSLARERYGKFAWLPADLLDTVRHRGFWTVARRQLRSGLVEVRDSTWRRGYLQRCRRYCPSLTMADLVGYGSGIRAQAVLRDGTLVDDFRFQRTERALHVVNAPSPAATSAMPIAGMIADRLAE